MYHHTETGGLSTRPPVFFDLKPYQKKPKKGFPNPKIG